MPVPLLEAYARELPRLEAQQQLAAATAVAVGGGTAGREGTRLMRDWQKAANGAAAGRQPGGGQRGVGSAASLAQMAAMGIAIAVEG